jgi:hypothetical protein
MQFDNLGRHVKVKVTSDGEAYNVPDGLTAVIKYKKPDGYGIFNPCTIKDGNVEFDFTEEMLAASGNCRACIVLMDGEETISTMTFTLIIDATALPNKEIESSYEYDELTKIMADQGSYRDEAKGYSEDAKENATLSRSYAIGGTGTRTGEDEDNAQYYSNQSQQYAQDAKTSAAAIANVLYADEDGYLCIGDEEGE